MIAHCAVQVLPPLNIKGTCRIQRLPAVSIAGPNSQAAAHGTEFNTIDNNRYVQIVHEEVGKLQTAATAVAPHGHDTESHTNETPIVVIPPLSVINPKKISLAITAVSTDSYGEETLHQPTSTCCTNTEEEYITTTETPYSSAFEETNTSTSAVENTEERPDSALTSISRTDDEKIRNACCPKPHKLSDTKQSKPMQKRLTSIDGKSPASAVKKAAQIERPVYSATVMKIIEEIFEITPHKCKGTESVPIAQILQSSQANTNDAPATTADVPPKDCQSVGIQTTQQKPTGQQSESTSALTQSPLNLLHPIESEHDVEEASDEHIRITEEIFKQIRERKAERYQRSSVANRSQQRLVEGAHLMATETLPLQEHCQHTQLINQSLTDTFAKYPDLKKYFEPADAKIVEVPAKTLDIASKVFNETTASCPTVSNALPSVRLQNLRKQQQQQQKHQELLAKHPRVQRTIDIIRKDAANTAAAAGKQNNLSVRHEKTANEVQEAAKRFLESVRSPKKRLLPPVYVENSVQAEAEAFLLSIEQPSSATKSSVINSMNNGTDLFCTESSLKSASALTTTDPEIQIIDTTNRSELLCTASDSTQRSASKTTTSSSSSKSNDDLISSVLVSPLKLSRTQSLQTNSEAFPVETPTTTSNDDQSSSTCDGGRTLGQSTTSSMERHITRKRNESNLQQHHY